MSALRVTASPTTCHPERSEPRAQRAIRGVEGPLLSYSALRYRIAAVCRIAAAILQEIFDESAYDRFLKRNHLQSSAKAYATFQQENEQSRARRPRCC